MIRFANLYGELDSTTKTNEKISAMVNYFANVEPADAAWATYFLSGSKLRRLVPSKLLRKWAAEEAGIPDWLFDESYQSVGDLAETISLVVPPGEVCDDAPLASWVTDRMRPLGKMDESDQRRAVIEIWRHSTPAMRLVTMKLITGAFRIGVSKRLLTRAIASHSGIPTEVVAHRLMGEWEPTAEFFQRVIDDAVDATLPSQPYPFCLAHPLDPEEGPAPLGEVDQYLVEWKWDGIRGQVIRREDSTYIWSRGEELMENRWPEIESAAAQLPDGVVLDGEILAATAEGEVLPFAQLQRRIGRKKVGKKLLAEVPVVFHAFDLLERDGCDLRDRPLADRRVQLEQIVQQANHPHLHATELITQSSWDDFAKTRKTSREHRAEGLMLKRKDAAYDVGRVKGTWWKWKIDPFTIDAVLIYAQKGHGRRASLFSDYTFALWQDGTLVPFAKAYSGLTDAEIRKVDRFIRQNTNDSFGPVRSVTPQLVMEVAFEGLQRSSRHKSGVATRFPRIVRWRHDKQPNDANSLADLMEMMPD
ncbi:MAG: ATP-dependent DNA ligase [Rubripirellula sp.]